MSLSTTYRDRFESYAKTTYKLRYPNPSTEKYTYLYNVNVNTYLMDYGLAYSLTRKNEMLFGRKEKTLNIRIFWDFFLVIHRNNMTIRLDISTWHRSHILCINFSINNRDLVMKEPFSFSFRSQHFDFFRNIKEHLPILFIILFKRKKVSLEISSFPFDNVQHYFELWSTKNFSNLHQNCTLICLKINWNWIW